MKRNRSPLLVVCVLSLFGFGTANAADKATRVPVLEAFNKGNVEIVFDATTVKASGKLAVSVRNLTTSPLNLTLPKGPTAFKVGGPLGTLTVESESIQNLDILPGKVKGLQLSQSDKDRLTGGKLTIKMTPNGISANAENVSIGSMN